MEYEKWHEVFFESSHNKYYIPTKSVVLESGRRNIRTADVRHSRLLGLQTLRRTGSHRDVPFAGGVVSQRGEPYPRCWTDGIRQRRLVRGARYRRPDNRTRPRFLAAYRNQRRDPGGGPYRPRRPGRALPHRGSHPPPLPRRSIFTAAGS